MAAETNPSRPRALIVAAAAWIILSLIPCAAGPMPTAAIPLSPAEQNAAMEAMGKNAPRGAYPRAFHGEQSYWTLVGVDGGAQSGLISEDGAVELGKGGVSVEPFIIEDGRLTTWASATVAQSLEDGYLPIPSVAWRKRGWELKITAFAAGEAKGPRLVVRYALRNLTGRRRRLMLVLSVRPFQVDGPEQFLNSPGGVSPLRDLAWDGARLAVNGRTALYPTTVPDRFVTFRGVAVTAGALLASGAGGPVHDPRGLASGALIYSWTLRPGEKAAVALVAPLAEAALTSRPSLTGLDQEERAVASDWRSRLGRVDFTVPRAGRAVVDTLRTSLAYMLMSREGAILRPGTRSYDRSWIRDGAMISEALLRLGDTEAAADYLRWYAPYQFADGKVPCCVDTRGADPTFENDSEGELIFLAAEVYRYGRDMALLRSLWPRIQMAASYMDGLRRAERTAANETPDRRMLYGLMPASISHEGYSSKPAYSYWDDFWALRGYDDAVFIATTLGDQAALARLAAARNEFRADLDASIVASARFHTIDYIPGAADLGDFDATSTTIALAPGGQGDRLPKGLLNNTFERYWRTFLYRRDTDRYWEAYTPYELRTVGTFVRLGRRDRALALLDYFMKDRRPLAWNGWAEVVGRDARKPRFIGDMPHAWVASDYVRSVLDMFAFDRERDHALVLAAGIPPAWFEHAGVGVRNLGTPYGAITWSAKSNAHGLIVRIGGDARPPSGYVFAWPFADPPGLATLNGHALIWREGALSLPGSGELVIRRP
jgi:hypothetical protein